MVHEVAAAVKLPLIGIGGIASTTDVLEFMIAGASAIQIGTANYYDPLITSKVVDGLSEYCRSTGITAISSIVRSLV
jgi:dihydroorotate dehydrogenase (NAD+) catalytic subunit